MEWLIDSGAKPNLIDNRVYEVLAEEVRTPLSPVRKRLLGANGTELSVNGEAEILLEAGEQTYEVKVIVADLHGLQGILGMEFFVPNECSLNLHQGYIDCGKVRHRLYRRERAIVQPVRLAETVLVPEEETVVGGDLFCAKQVFGVSSGTKDEPLARESDLVIKGTDSLSAFGTSAEVTIINVGREAIWGPKDERMGKEDASTDPRWEVIAEALEVSDVTPVGQKIGFPEYLQDLYENAKTQLGQDSEWVKHQIDKKDRSPECTWLEPWTVEEVKKQQEADPQVGLVRERVIGNQPRPSEEELLAPSLGVRTICTWWPWLSKRDVLLYRRRPPRYKGEKLHWIEWLSILWVSLTFPKYSQPAPTASPVVRIFFDISFRSCCCCNLPFCCCFRYLLIFLTFCSCF